MESRLIELFEFEVIRDEGEPFGDEFGSRFIKEFLEPNSLFWGGGGDERCIRGVISSEFDPAKGIELILNEFNAFFDPHDRVSITFL